MEWTITRNNEDTQSSTFMPLICSVIDGFQVTFPHGYEEIFNASLTGQPFRNFKEFQVFLRKSIEKRIGKSTSEHFKLFQDHKYHLRPTLQESILGDGTPHKYDDFYGLFIIQLKRQLAGQKCILVDIGHQAAHGEHLASHRAAARAEIEAHRREAHRAERPIVWHFRDDAGNLIPFDEETNTEINLCLEFDQPPIFKKIDKHEYLIDPRAKTLLNMKTGTTRPIVKDPRWHYIDNDGIKVPYSKHVSDDITDANTKGEAVVTPDYVIIPQTRSEVNKRTGKSRHIVYEGGKTKRRRSLYKRTRHHA